MADIVERLREYTSQRLSAHLSECDDPLWPTPHDVELSKDALDEIESLRSRADKAEAERLTMTKRFNGAVGLKEQQRMRAEYAEATCEKLAKALQWCLDRDERNGSLPEAYCGIIRKALSYRKEASE